MEFYVFCCAKVCVGKRQEPFVSKLEMFLNLNEYNILKDNGKIKREIADKLALDEYEKYRVVQDQKYISDFDELVLETKNIESQE